MKYTYNDRVLIQAGEARLHGHLVIPVNAKGIVLFAQCIGSCRMSRSYQKLAAELAENELGTFMFDLLTEEEDGDHFKKFDIELLTGRLVIITQWLRSKPSLYKYPLGYFGTGIGAAAALDAASILPDIHGVVCYDGRPDLSVMPLAKLTTPVLLITGKQKPAIQKINEEALRSLACPKKFEMIQEDSYYIQDSAVMDKIALAAGKWFFKYLRTAQYELVEPATNKLNMSLKKYKA